MGTSRVYLAASRPVPAVAFLTWRLDGAMPYRVEFSQADQTSEGRRFLAIDRAMDQALTGPVWLEQPLVAASLCETLRMAERQWGFCKLLAWVVMPNHVHALLRPNRPIVEIGRAIRKTSARLANEVLGREGLPFWHDGTYEYWPSDDAETDRIARYIESNPVTAGLVERAEDWPWSSAHDSAAPETGDESIIELASASAA